MARFLLTVAATSLVVVLLIGALGFVAVRSVLGPQVAAAAGVPFAAADFPPEIQGMRHLPAAERFSHFQGAQIRFTDANNTSHTVNVTPGTVTAVTGSSLTVDTNSGGSKTYSLTGSTRIHMAAHPAEGSSSQSAPKVGDKVVVITFDDSSEARAVAIGGPEGFAPWGGPWHGGNH